MLFLALTRYNVCLTRYNVCLPGFLNLPSPGQQQWSERDGFSNHQRLDCLLNSLVSCRSNKASKLRVTSLCEGNSLRASNAGNVSIWWRHHANCAVSGLRDDKKCKCIYLGIISTRVHDLSLFHNIRVNHMVPLFVWAGCFVYMLELVAQIFCQVNNCRSEYTAVGFIENKYSTYCKVCQLFTFCRFALGFVYWSTFIISIKITSLVLGQ